MFINDAMCSPRKYPYSPGYRRDWNFLGVVGFCKTQKIKEMKVSWNFQKRQGGFLENIPPV